MKACSAMQTMSAEAAKRQTKKRKTEHNKRNRIMMNIPIILPTKTFGAILALGVACVAQAQTQPTVYHITENNESLTTDIPGATITVTPSILNQEQWTVTLGGGYTFSQGLVNPQYQIGEPESPSGAYVNLFADLPSWYAGTPNPPPYSSSIGYWISDTPNPSEYVYPSPDPV